MIESPLVTVVICNYNTGGYLQQSIASVLQQTYQNWELIIIDDGSTDNSISILAELTDPRIRVLYHTENKGVAYSRSEGIQQAKGAYVCWLDADDMALPDRLQQQVKWFQNNPTGVLCAMGAHFVTQQNEWTYRQSVEFPDTALKAALFFRFPFINSTIAMLTKAAKQALPATINYKQAEDYILYARLITVGSFVCLANPGVAYRIHQSPNRITSDNNNADIVFGRMIAWRQMLSLLNLNASDQLLMLHDKLSYYRNRITPAELLLASEYLQLLTAMCSQNKLQGVFDKNFFEQEISARVYSLLIHGSLSFGQTIHLYLRNRQLLKMDLQLKLLPNKLRRMAVGISN